MKTVKELIIELKKIDNKKAQVSLEGCDCYGDWNGDIEYYTLDGVNYCLLKRD